MKLEYRVIRGKNKGKILTPHKFKDGHYVVSKTRFKSDHIMMSSIIEVYDHLKKGYRVRMGNTEHKISPSLIKLDSIEVISK
ncbi:hypothetical protein [Methylobacter psychrophilus]|uniref:hypothetical protein n=1 Tax=Methylobacter psychrophilus TaxID=96941 RepID=UPI0021D4EF6E|nr:hypothetical protein [Methylobacter psychrophilus]